MTVFLKSLTLLKLKFIHPLALHNKANHLSLIGTLPFIFYLSQTVEGKQMTEPEIALKDFLLFCFWTYR